MNTQYEKNSIYLACSVYRMRKRERELRIKLTVFFTALAVLCGICCAVIFAVSQ